VHYDQSFTPISQQKTRRENEGKKKKDTNDSGMNREGSGAAVALLEWTTWLLLPGDGQAAAQTSSLHLA